jgi:hypothetical protein
MLRVRKEVTSILMTAHKLIEDDNMDWVVPQAYKKEGK